MLERGPRWQPWFVLVSCFSPPSFCSRGCITCQKEFWPRCMFPWVLSWSSLTGLRSVCLVLISLLAEIPEVLEYYWRSVIVFFRRVLGRLDRPPFVCRMRSWIDLALMFLTFTLTIGWSVEVGVAVSIVISLLLVIHRSSKARLMILVSHQLWFLRLVPWLD